MSKYFALTIASFLALVASIDPLWAQLPTVEDGRLCSLEAEPDKVLRACAPFINSRRYPNGRHATAAEIARVYAFRAQAYISKGQYDFALRELEQSALLDPDYSEHHRLRASVYVAVENKDEEKAIEQLQIAAAKGREGIYRAVALFQLAELHMRRQEYDQAMIEVDKAIRANPKFSVSYALRAFLRLFKGDRSAEADIRTAIQLFPAYKQVFEDEFARKRHLVNYLKEIEAGNDFSNWTVPPTQLLKSK